MILTDNTQWFLTEGKSVGLQTYELIRNQIIHGYFAPGMRISEAEVSRTLKISRQPVREAFIKLRDEGLVEVRPQRGTYVTKISIEAVNDARFIREAVEADIIKLLVKNRSHEMVDILRAQIKQQRLLQEKQLEEFLQLDELFHRTLSELAGKGNVWKFIAGTKAHFDRVRYLASNHKPIQPLVDQHESIVEAIAERDTTLARKAIRSHLQVVLQDLPVLISQQPEIFIDKGGR
ncbi:GntR family transcriptional regulator [Desulfogranum japonicum]|uniref:GntR family transcriptional regulator n=1 Tax=Desulfogranum japonicum TaxID=231447 RepID=UPI000428BC0E|nr:GntR family transcriptional regulator [Desulfogranum japonicum]